MSIYKVDRRVDTVRIEMDISVAEQILEILGAVHDDTSMAKVSGSDITDLVVRLSEDAEVRSPSPLYIAEANNGYVNLRDTTHAELMVRREASR